MSPPREPFDWKRFNEIVGGVIPLVLGLTVLVSTGYYVFNASQTIKRLRLAAVSTRPSL